MKNASKLLKYGAPSAIALLLAFTAMGHTSQGRRIWKSMRGEAGAGCPFASQDAASRDAQRRAAAQALRGAQQAKAMPALGFVFDKTKRGDVDAWVRAHDGKCAIAQASGDMECQLEHLDFADSEISGRPGTVFFTFDASGLLKKLMVMTAFEDAHNAASVAQNLVRSTTQRVGAEPGVRGEFSGPFLAKGQLQQAAAEFKLANYYARTQVTTLGARYSLQQTYQTLVD